MPRRPQPKPVTTRAGRYEFAKTGIARWDWADPYHLAVALTWPQFLAAFLALEIALNCLFALAYLAVPGSIANATPGAFADAFFFSLETLATVGYGDWHPATTYGHIVSSIEILAGVLFTALMTGLFFVRFSRPRARIHFAEKIVVTRHNGRTTLMVRLGNGRQNLIANAAARLDALLPDRSAEGQSFRRIHELHLVQPRLPIFALTWTLMHVIDERSPLHGHDAARLAADGVRLFVSAEARDVALAATVHDMVAYDADDILFNTRYVDAVGTDAEGRPIADMTRLSHTEPDEMP